MANYLVIIYAHNLLHQPKLELSHQPEVEINHKGFFNSYFLCDEALLSMVDDEIVMK